MKHTIKDPKFFEGGHATFTIHNDKGDHYTYRINKSKDGKVFFVSLLTGSENYTYMGLYRNISGDVKLTNKSKYNENSKPYQVINWALKRVHNGVSLPDGYDIHHEGRCCRCGRELTTPESVELGIGPKCRGMM